MSRATHATASDRASVASRARGRRLRWLAAAALVAVSASLIVRAADGALLREGLAELARSPGLVAVLVAGYAAAFALRALA